MATGSGAGCRSAGGTVSLTSSALSSNTAQGGDGGAGSASGYVPETSQAALAAMGSAACWNSTVGGTVNVVSDTLTSNAAAGRRRRAKPPATGGRSGNGVTAGVRSWSMAARSADELYPVLDRHQGGGGSHGYRGGNSSNGYSGALPGEHGHGQPDQALHLTANTTLAARAAPAYRPQLTGGLGIGTGGEPLA